MDATYRWYRVGYYSVLSTNATYTFTPSAGSTEYYYCMARASSNPESDATSFYVLVTSSTDVVATVDEDSYRFHGSYGGAAYFYADLSYSQSTNLSYNQAVTITATAEDSSGNEITGFTPEYRWYGRNGGGGGGGGWSQVGTGRTLTLYAGNTSYNYYRCEITINGGSAAVSTSFYFSRSWWGGYYYINESGSGSSGYYTVATTYFNVDVTATGTGGSSAMFTATAVGDPSGEVLSGTFTYRWYDTYGNYYGSGSSITVSLPSYVSSRIYYCRAYPGSGSDYAASYNIVVSRGGVTAAVQTSGAEDGSYYPVSYTSAGNINTERVDSASYVYTAITNIKDRANVMSVSEIDSSILESYLSLSKPEIDLASYPTVYSIDSGTMTAMAGDTLSYYVHDQKRDRSDAGDDHLRLPALHRPERGRPVFRRGTARRHQGRKRREYHLSIDRYGRR